MERSPPYFTFFCQGTDHCRAELALFTRAAGSRVPQRQLCCPYALFIVCPHSVIDEQWTANICHADCASWAPSAKQSVCILVTCLHTNTTRVQAAPRNGQHRCCGASVNCVLCNRNAVIPRNNAVHLSRLRYFSGFFFRHFLTSPNIFASTENH